MNDENRQNFPEMDNEPFESTFNGDDTLNALHTKSAEAQTVDEIISMEVRVDYLEREIAYLEHVQFENGFFDTYSEWIDDKIDDLQSELSDIERELKS